MYDPDIMHRLKKYQDRNKTMLFQKYISSHTGNQTKPHLYSCLNHCLRTSHTEWCSAPLSSTGNHLASPQLFLFSCRPWLWPDSTTYSPWPQRPSFTWPSLRSATTEKQTSPKHCFSSHICSSPELLFAWLLYMQNKKTAHVSTHCVLSLLSALSAAHVRGSWAGSECPAWSHWACSGPRISHG